MLHLKLTEKQAKILLDHYVKRQKEIGSKLDELEKELAENNTVIKLLTSTMVKTSVATEVAVATQQPSNMDPDYEPSWSWIRKAQYILSKSNKPMSVRQILERIYKYEPELKIDDRKNMATLSASVISKVKRSDILVRVDEGTGVFYKVKS
jgi:hypothetical protein